MASAHAVFASIITPIVAPSRSINVPFVPYSSSFPSHLLCPVIASGGSYSGRCPSSTAVAHIQPPSASHGVATKLYVSDLSFRTTEESLRGAFERFSQLTEVNLVIDRVAKRPRGFVFLSYANEEESKNAMEGMHGKVYGNLIDICKLSASFEIPGWRVIFVEVAKSKV